MHHSRSQKILKIFEKLVEKYSEDSNIGMLYIDWLLRQHIEMITFKNPEINDFIEKVNQIEKKYNFSQDVLDYNEFKKNKVLAEYYSANSSDLYLNKIYFYKNKVIFSLILLYWALWFHLAAAFLL